MSRLRALLYALFALLVGVLAYMLGVGSSLGQRAEASLLDASAFTTNPPAPLGLVTTVSVALAIAAICLIALWVHGIGRAFSILLFGAMAIAGSQLLKENWLERPQLFEFDEINTFPSGHMTVFGVVAAGMVWAMPKGARWATSLLAATLLGIVSWQLLEYGWHRPSDLIGAQALVVLSFAVASWIGPRGSRRSNGAGAALSTVNRFTSIALTLAGIVIVLGGLVLAWAAASTHSDELMLSAGEVALVGVSALSARTLARLCP